jgi:hypothetical protein
MSKSPKKSTKSVSVTRLLSRERGATMAEIVKSTGWKVHSVRAFLTGVRKSATLVKEQRSDGGTAYRISHAEPTSEDMGEGAAS